MKFNIVTNIKAYKTFYVIYIEAIINNKLDNKL